MKPLAMIAAGWLLCVFVYEPLIRVCRVLNECGHRVHNAWTRLYYEGKRLRHG